MRCPFCSGSSKVIDKRETEKGEYNRRRRECLSCNKRFTTHERVELIPLQVIKKDGRIEPFSREKVKSGIIKACNKRPVNEEKIESTIDEIENVLMSLDDVKITSKIIGELVLSKLREVDLVAYIRFSSVYHDFSKPENFKREVQNITKEEFESSRKELTHVRKRDGRIVKFEIEKIANAIFKAARSVGGRDRHLAEELSIQVVNYLKKNLKDEIPGVEDVQDAVEKVLIENGHAKTAKSFILYRDHHMRLRNFASSFLDVQGTINEYLNQTDWRVKENSNTDYSFSGLLLHTSGKVIANYALEQIYPKDVSDAHRNAYIHIHDLSAAVVGYCAGWSLKNLLVKGFGNVPNKVDTVPAKHLDVVVSQMVNYIGCLQMEFAGAQAFSSVDTLLAPFVKADNLSYRDTKQNIQKLIFSLNIPSRWGSQMPFSNLTFDFVVPEDMKDEPAIVGGKMMDFTYGNCQKEMDMINKAFLEIMLEGDAKGRLFTFPIPTYNITKDFDWDSPIINLLFELTSKYGSPYFQNYIGSNLDPRSIRAMCCRLNINMTELVNRPGHSFAAGDNTGSIGVVTINLNRLGYENKSKEEFFNKLYYFMELSKQSLEIKRKVVNTNLKNGLMPYTKAYLGTFDNHFSTIGVCGMNECCLNFLGKDITTEEGKAFAIEVLSFMREILKKFQQETKNLYNLEATPAESTAYRFAKKDKDLYPNIITAGKDVPFLTNSTHIPVNATNDIFSVLEHQNDIQPLYTGGTVLHIFLGERISDIETCKQLVRKIARTSRIPYFTITPTFSVCPDHGYISGAHETCPMDAHSGGEDK